MDRQTAPAEAPSDEELLAASARGEAWAARALADRYGARLIGLATRLLGGDRAEAEDIAQEALLRLWRIAPDWRRGEAQVATWLYRVLRNLCTDRLRRRGRVVPGLDAAPDPADPAQSAAERLQDKARLAALDAALMDLPDRQREAVVLRHIEGLANPDIAAIMDISVEAVESLTARGKRALALALAGRREELGFEDG